MTHWTLICRPAGSPFFFILTPSSCQLFTWHAKYKNSPSATLLPQASSRHPTNRGWLVSVSWDGCEVQKVRSFCRHDFRLIGQTDCSVSAPYKRRQNGSGFSYDRISRMREISWWWVCVNASFLSDNRGWDLTWYRWVETRWLIDDETHRTVMWLLPNTKT